MSWTVSPDLKGVRDYLSCERAFLLEIIESNNWERPIYWTLGMDNRYLGGLDSCGSYKGLVYKLLLFKTSETEYEVDASSLKNLCEKIISRIISQFWKPTNRESQELYYMLMQIQ